MAINQFLSVTTVGASPKSPRATAIPVGANAGVFTMAYDSAAVTTMDQLRQCVAAAMAQAAGQLTGP